MTWSQENCLVMNHCLYLRVTGKGFYRERISCARIMFFVSLSPFCMQEGDFYFRDSGSISKDVE